MQVTKRNGKREDVSMVKITNRLKNLSTDLNTDYVDIDNIAIKVVQGLYDGVSTTDLDNLAAETAASMATIHPDYNKLAAKIAISNLYKETSNSWSASVKKLYNYINPKTNKHAPLVNDVILAVANHKELSSIVNNLCEDGKVNDNLFDYFGFKTLEKSYLLRCDGNIVERPQYLYMRVALALHCRLINGELTYDLNKIKESYRLFSEHFYTHATPTLFNAGTMKQQLSSCFLLSTTDSISGIYKTLSDCAAISQNAGGIGLSFHNVRSKNSYISGTGGTSNGLVPMLKVFNETARYVDQGGGKRKGAFAAYLEPWHPDVFDFLDLKKNHGKEEMRARDLFYAMWINDLFMQRVKENGQWSLFDPNECPELYETHSEEFEKHYLQYEQEGRAVKTIEAQELWFKILDSQIETGTPYMLYKDACNSKSNQQNLGTIRSSNLCTEIIEYTSEDEIAVCNLASISLPKLVTYDGKGVPCFDFEELDKVVSVVTQNLNIVLDINYNPTPEGKNSNEKHRPIGIGVQGLADVYAMMKMDFDSEEAAQLNKEIFERMYFTALKESMQLAKKTGAYQSFKGSPLSEGKFQFDLWDENHIFQNNSLNWDGLKKDIIEYGVKNSLLFAPMPTASTSQIMNNNECFEPFNSNMYTRRTLSGEYVVVNKHLVRDLLEVNMWDEQMRQNLMEFNGSVQRIERIPIEIRNRYKTAYELSQKVIIDQAADRGRYICQSQSMNLFVSEPNFAKLSSMHFYAWEKGLKTGMYYLRSKGAVDPIKFTLNKDKTVAMEEPQACLLDDPDCLACGA